MNWGGGTVPPMPGGDSAEGFDREGVSLVPHGTFGARLAL